MKKKIFLVLIMSIFLLPVKSIAYSNKIIVGGETIGIEIHSDGIYVVGFYEVNEKNIAQNAGFQVGDIIKEINNRKIEDIYSLNQILDREGIYTFKVERNHNIKEIELEVKEDNNILKTGLYVKDQINGIGTLSYIDPETKIYGSLGHEIIESTSFSKFEMQKGKIYKAEVSSINKSKNNNPGEKNAIINKDEETGTINLNETEGIFGEFTDTLPNKELTEVSQINEIRKGKAIIKTVLEKDIVEDFEIEILNIDEESTSKNILFEITDKRLLKESGGIVQGMSGSPIIQNNKIIGVVNYVIVEEAKKGYGIFITSMLEKGDKILS